MMEWASDNVASIEYVLNTDVNLESAVTLSGKVGLVKYGIGRYGTVMPCVHEAIQFEVLWRRV